MTSAAPGYVAPSATDVALDRIQFATHASWDSARKLEVVARRWLDAREFSLAGLRLRHPLASTEELELREAALRLGEDLARKVCGERVGRLVR